jgi:hypothetical protein
LWGFANCASLCLLDMTRNAPHFWTISLGAWSASYGLSVFDRSCTGC